VREADLTIVGSFVPEGVAVGEWVNKEASGLTAFYDIDTPVTLNKLARGDYEYLAPHLIAQYDLYLSFTGGQTLQALEDQYGAPTARPLYCSVDPSLYYPDPVDARLDLGYLGTYSDDRQGRLNAPKKGPEAQSIVVHVPAPNAPAAWVRLSNRYLPVTMLQHRRRPEAQISLSLVVPFSNSL